MPQLLLEAMRYIVFAGGSQVLQRGLLPRRAALWASLASLLLAIGVALILQVGYKTGKWTIPFAAMGMLGGFFYSTRPPRWVSRGWGELWIAFCYAWLPLPRFCALRLVLAAEIGIALPVHGLGENSLHPRRGDRPRTCPGRRREIAP